MTTGTELSTLLTTYLHNDVSLSAADKLLYLNLGQKRIVRDAPTVLRKKLASLSISVAGDREYSLASDFYMMAGVWIKSVGIKLFPMGQSEFIDDVERMPTIASSHPTGYIILGYDESQDTPAWRIRFNKTPDGDYTVYYWYYYFPPVITAGSTPVISSIGYDELLLWASAMIALQPKDPEGFNLAAANYAANLQAFSSYIPVSPDYTPQLREDTNYRSAQRVQVISGYDLSTALADTTNDTAGDYLIGYKASGTGAVARTVHSRFADDEMRVTDFGADITGLSDCTSAFQAAFDAANAASKSVRIPAGRYLVNSTVNGYSYLHINGAGEQSVIIPGMSDDTPVFEFAASTSMWKIEGIRIYSAINLTNFLAGTEDGQNAIGIRIGVGGYSTRATLRDVHVRGLAVGYNLKGFMLNLDNVYATYCETGLIGDDLNGSDLNLRLENNRKSFEIIDSNGVLFRNLVDEEAGAVGVVSATIDACKGVEFIAPYWETAQTDRTTPFLTIGATTLCRQVRITSGLVEGGVMEQEVGPITADKVNGLYVDCYWSEGGQLRKITTTANTINYSLNGSSSGGFWQHDISKQLGSAFNYWPNRNFELWLRGWEGIGAVNCTISKETTLVRKGQQAVRVTASAGTTSPNLQMSIGGGSVLALRGKTARLGVWAWVPNIDEYDESPRTESPTIRLGSYNGSTTWSSTYGNIAARGTWNFMDVNLSIDADATVIYAQIFVEYLGVACSGNEYIVVGGITLVEDSVPYYRQLNDDIKDSTQIYTIGVNGKMVGCNSYAPNDADQIYEVGDVVFNSNPSAGGLTGWICTTAGSPGTWSTLCGSNTGSTTHAIDVVASNTQQVRISSTSTDSATKAAYVEGRHYLNAEEDIAIIAAYSTSTDNIIYIGGASASQNTATSIQFFTAANYNTVTGTKRLEIEASGHIIIPSLPEYANNTAATGGGLTAGHLYRTGGDPDTVCIVH